MDTFKLFKDFITPAEQAVIVEWAVDIKEQCIDRQHWHSGGKGRRLSNRVRAFRFRPDIICELEDRFEETLKLTGAKRLNYKIVIHELGADTKEHTDEYVKEHPVFARAAILVQAATKGGVFEVNKDAVDFPELSMMNFCGDSPHGVTVVTSGERILLRAHWSEK